MIFYKTLRSNDPYFELWNRETWLHPIENADMIHFPLIITVEPTNKCNLSCLYCCRQMMDRKMGYMSLEHIEKISIECAQHKSAIRYGGFGEPLFHPNIIDFIKINKNYDVLTTVFTNASAFTDEMARAFVEFGLDEIRFSTAGITREEHNKVRQKSDYDDGFWDKIKLLDQVKKERGSTKPYITLYSHVLDYEDQSFKKTLDEYVKEALKYVDKVDIDLTMYSRVKELDHVKDLYEAQTINETYKPCVELFLKSIVHWNGDVFACDLPYNTEEKFLMGNLDDPDFDIGKAVASNKQQKLREKFSFNLEHAESEMCKNCYSNTNKWDAIIASQTDSTIFENAFS